MINRNVLIAVFAAIFLAACSPNADNGWSENLGGNKGDARPRDLVVATDEQWEAMMQPFRALVHGYELGPDDPARDYTFMLSYPIPAEEEEEFLSMAELIRECTKAQIACHIGVPLALHPLSEFRLTADKLCALLGVSEGKPIPKYARIGLVYTDERQADNFPCLCLSVMYFDARLYERYDRFDMAVPYDELTDKGAAKQCRKG